MDNDYGGCEVIIIIVIVTIIIIIIICLVIANFLIHIVTSTAQTDLLRQVQFHENFCLGLLLQAWSAPRLLLGLGPLCSFHQPGRKTRKHKKVPKKSKITSNFCPGSVSINKEKLLESHTGSSLSLIDQNCSSSFFL